MECENCPSGPRQTQRLGPTGLCPALRAHRSPCSRPGRFLRGDTPTGNHCEPEPGHCRRERPQQRPPGHVLPALRCLGRPWARPEATLPGAWAQRPGKSMPWGLAGSGEGTRHRKGSLLLGILLGGQWRWERLRYWQCWSVCGADGRSVKREHGHRRSGNSAWLCAQS